MRRISAAVFGRGCMGSCRLSSSTPLGMSGFTYAPFNEGADAYLDRLQQKVEESDLVEDVNLSDGVLEIDTRIGKFVINKQAPKMQLWLSSPISGPRHYDMVEPSAGGTMDWRCDKDGHRLSDRLGQELTKAIGIEVELP